MATVMYTEGKAVFMEAITYDTAGPYDSLYVNASGNVSIVPIKNSGTPVVLALDKGWHPIAFTLITTANTDVAAADLFGCRGQR